VADNYSFKDASGNTQSHASKDVGAGVHASKHVPVDDAGVLIAKAEDAAHSSGDKGYMLLAVRKDTAAALAGADGDYIPLIVDANGRLHVAGNAAGDVAHDAADSGFPLKVGGKAATATPTAVANGDRVNAYFDANGRLVVVASTGAADDEAAAGELYPAAGVYRATVDEVDSGDVGRVRMSRRRALIHAPDHQYFELDGTTPVPSGSDIVGLSGATLVAGDFNIRDTNNHFFYIPMAERGWRKLSVVFRSTSAFDQVMTVRLILAASNALTYGLLGEITMPASAVAAAFVPAGGLGAALGEIVGASTIVTGAVYPVPAFRDCGMAGIFLRASFSVAPTTGALALYINRQG
jgi:hypothetical protein